MPEGPEIRHAADKIATVVVGKPIKQVSFGLPRLKQWETQLCGQKVVRVETYGKAMLIRFNNQLNIYSHNQLYGRWVTSMDGLLPDTQRQLRIALYTETQAAFLYSASDIAVLRDHEIAEHPFIKKIGPDVLDKKVTEVQLVLRLTSKQYANRQLGLFLTDQKFMAGLGNYLRCEILFEVGLSPNLKPSQLNDEQLYKLAAAIIKLPRQSYETQGITNDLDLAEQLMRDGAVFEDARFYVFRRENLPCYRCLTSIKKVKSAGQSCYICPSCQSEN